MLIIFTLLIAISAVCYTDILTRDSMILYKPYVLAEKHLPEWLFYPLIGCHACVSGQWALWLYLFWVVGLKHYSFPDDFIVHIWFVLQTIFNAEIIHLLYMKIKESPAEKQNKISTPPEILQLKKH